MFAKRFFGIFLGCALCLAALTIVAGSAHAGGMLVGTNLGFTYYSPEQGDGLSAFSLPNQAGVGVLFQPGLRIGGFVDDARHQEIFVDTGLSWLSSGGSSVTSFQVLGGYQHCFGDNATAPFINGGVGVLHLGGDGGSSINVMVVGGGVGVRQTLAHGNGAVRAEVHFDRQFEDKDSGLQALNDIGVKLGFDLYVN